MPEEIAQPQGVYAELEPATCEALGRTRGRYMASVEKYAGVDRQQNLGALELPQHRNAYVHTMAEAVSQLAPVKDDLFIRIPPAEFDLWDSELRARLSVLPERLIKGPTKKSAVTRVVAVAALASLEIYDDTVLDLAKSYAMARMSIRAGIDLNASRALGHDLPAIEFGTNDPLNKAKIEAALLAEEAFLAERIKWYGFSGLLPRAFGPVGLILDGLL
jgi:hypothetical protein